jgi:glycerol-3-phosphate acyltransferase PlsY
MIKFIFLAIFSYLLGSVPFGHLVARVKKVDLTKIGSGSPTSTNVARALGWKWGMVSAILDVSKGIIPTIIALRYLGIGWQIMACALLPILGHIFPIFFNFQGGRGAATFLGASLALIGPRYFFPIFLVWILIFAITKIASLTNLIFPWLFSVFLYFYFPSYLAFGILAAILITFALKNNIKRLIRGEEPKIPLKL